tara:strand:- start:30389 stop:30634 length:246 start_codon:yes stop_codon:yes gene_type:complete
MHAKIQKWGNSLAVRLPANVANECQLENGSEVDLMIENNNIVIMPQIEEPSLTSLLAQVTNDNLHSPIDMGGDIGLENIDD